MSKYSFGRQFEYKTKKSVEKLGFFVIRSSGSTELCKPIRIKKDSELFNEALRRLVSVKLHLLNGKTKPSRDYDSKNNFECKYCDYNKKCWG